MGFRPIKKKINSGKVLVSYLLSQNIENKSFFALKAHRNACFEIPVTKRNRGLGMSHVECHICIQVIVYV